MCVTLYLYKKIHVKRYFFSGKITIAGVPSALVRMNFFGTIAVGFHRENLDGKPQWSAVGVEWHREATLRNRFPNSWTTTCLCTRHNIIIIRIVITLLFLAVIIRSWYYIILVRAWTICYITLVICIIIVMCVSSSFIRLG